MLEMLDNYKNAQRLFSWANLFGFNLHMGRTESDQPFVEVDGMQIVGDTPMEVMSAAAQAMGMEAERLE